VAIFITDTIYGLILNFPTPFVKDNFTGKSQRRHILRRAVRVGPGSLSCPYAAPFLVDLTIVEESIPPPATRRTAPKRNEEKAICPLAMERETHMFLMKSAPRNIIIVPNINEIENISQCMAAFMRFSL
jgi:hypothetical protein